MIPSVHPRGARVGGLIRYLYGPGKREEHVNPRLVAAWDGAGKLASLEPAVGSDGKFDVRRMVEFLEQPVRAGRNPPRLPVWHCSVRNDESDRILTDEQWAHIAREMMAGSGLAQHGDDQAVRWVAVRHNDDHIHIVATLVRQDRRTEWGRNDRWRCQSTARDLEERYGLYRLGPTDRTAAKRPHRPEVNKARRTGRGEPARDQLRRKVRYAAAAAASTDEFFDLLRQADLQVRLRHSTRNPDQVTGYSVALPGHTTADGQPVWYGGGRLAPDLTLPQLRTQRGWADPPPGVAATTPEQQAQLFEQAAEQVRGAAEDVRRCSASDPAAAGAAAYAAADTLTVAARLVEGERRGPLHRAAEALDRAAREPYRRQLPRTPRAEALRAMSRLLHLAEQLSDNPELFRMLKLLNKLAQLSDALAELRDAQQRLDQARAARTAARLLTAAGDRGVSGLRPAPDAGVTPPLTPAPTPHRDRRRQTGSTTTGRTR